MMKIGCDPEFIPIVGFKEKFNLYAVAKQGGWDNYDGGMPYDYSCDRDTKFGNIGQDGGNNCDSIGELRPKPGTPTQVVANIRNMMKYLQKNEIVADIIAGGGDEYRESIGGHIHFDFGLRGLENSYDGDAGDLGNDERNFIHVLDFFIGKPLKNKKGGRRSNCGYGELSDIRVASHGRSGKGLEYRTAPSWLTSPELAESVLWVAWAVAAHHKKNSSFWSQKINGFKASGHNPRNHHFSIQLRDLSTKDLSILKSVCPARGKKMIAVYGKLLKNKKFDLAQKGAITNWTGKKVTL